MKNIMVTIAFAFLSNQSAISQLFPKKYYSLINIADSLYLLKEYEKAATIYISAFRSNKELALPKHRYSAACAWALAGYPDSAFFQLNYNALRNDLEPTRFTIDPAFTSLYNDSRWNTLVEGVKNKKRSVVIKPKGIHFLLDSIFEEDQKYRSLINEVAKKYGQNSEQLIRLLNAMQKSDSLNLQIVEVILDKCGWIGPDIAGEKGNLTLFLIIQHSDLGIQKKYLPLMRDAVKKGNASSSDLALLEDRVALGQGKKQIYGSQIKFDEKTGKYFVQPIEDEVNVNKRRSKVGLMPLEEYTKNWNIDYKLPRKPFYLEPLFVLSASLALLFSILITIWRIRK